MTQRRRPPRSRLSKYQRARETDETRKRTDRIRKQWLSMANDDIVTNEFEGVEKAVEDLLQETLPFSCDTELEETQSQDLHVRTKVMQAKMDCLTELLSLSYRDDLKKLWLEQNETWKTPQSEKEYSDWRIYLSETIKDASTNDSFDTPVANYVETFQDAIDTIDESVPLNTGFLRRALKPSRNSALNTFREKSNLKTKASLLKEWYGKIGKLTKRVRSMVEETREEETYVRKHQLEEAYKDYDSDDDDDDEEEYEPRSFRVSHPHSGTQRWKSRRGGRRGRRYPRSKPPSWRNREAEEDEEASSVNPSNPRHMYSPQTGRPMNTTAYPNYQPPFASDQYYAPDGYQGGSSFSQIATKTGKFVGGTLLVAAVAYGALEGGSWALGKLS